MPNQNKSIPKNYDTSDMHDLASMAENDMQWSFTAINALNKKIAELKENLEKSYKVHDFYFAELETLGGMFEYLADNRLVHHAEEAESYSKEWEQENKKEYCNA